MEDVLDVYTRPDDPRFPPVCLDETHTQLLGEVRDPPPAASGRAARHDPEYVRGGVANLFLVCEPLCGWRHVTVTNRRTGVDWAHCVKELVDVQYPAAERIVLVLDQLNTHTVASRYEAFAPAEAKRLADRLEIPHTPKHGSWLNLPKGHPRRSSSACGCGHVSGNACRMLSGCGRKSAAGKTPATWQGIGSTGASRRLMRGSSSSISIPLLNAVHSPCQRTSRAIARKDAVA